LKKKIPLLESIIRNTIIAEMPHYDSIEFGLIDLNIEKYNVPKEQKIKYLNANLAGNLYAKYKNSYLKFNNYVVYKATVFPKEYVLLPDNWIKLATIIKNK